MDSLTLSFSGGADQYETAVFGIAQQVIDSRRAALADQANMANLQTAMNAAHTTWVQAQQKASLSANDPNLAIAALEAQIAYSAAASAFTTAIGNSTAVATARTTIYAQFYANTPGLLVNPGAVEQV